MKEQNTASTFKSRRMRIASYDDLKAYRVVSKMLPEFQANLGTGDVNNPTVMFVVALEDKEAGVILVCTERGWDKHADKIQNIKGILTSQHAYARIVEAIAPPDAIKDYINRQAKLADERNREHAEEDTQLHNAALQELENLVRRACMEGASDIHISVRESDAKIHFRIDGRHAKPFIRERDAIRPMVAAAMNAKSQDFNSTFNENEVNAVTVSVPTVTYTDRDSGETVHRNIRLRLQKTPQQGGFRVTARIQDTNTEDRLTLEDLGLEPDVAKVLTDAFSQPDGIVIFTGPVGQGKTSTMVALNDIPIRQKKKIISLEDPIEIIQPDIQQTLCIPGHPVLNFPNMIKVTLREDMDVLEISETRDMETATAAMRAAITGHLVISTLHANTAMGAIPRLIDLGISPRNLATPGVLRYLTGQRLVPTLCPHCRVQQDAHMHPIPASAGFKGPFIFRRNSKGCVHCDYKGEKGRVLILEVIVVDQESRRLIGEEDLVGWSRYLYDNGFKNMAHRAWRKVELGLIDPYLAAQKVPDMWGDEGKPFNYDNVLKSPAIMEM